jgi:nucleoside-diphosphate-sugar epimerase
MTKILITGANSFIGTNFRNISKYRNTEEISLKEKQPEEIDFSQFEVVLHLAAIVHQSKKIEEKEYFYVNRDLCLRVAELAKMAGVRQFIFLSTVKVYGSYIPGSGPWNEDSACNPEEAYGRSKFEAELGLKKLESPDFIISIIRTPIVYGPGVTANILKLIKLIETFPLLPFGRVNNNRHYTYVDNLVGFIDRIIETGASGIFIVMDDKALSTTDLVLNLSIFLHRKCILFRVPELFINAGVALMPEIFERLYRSFYMDNAKTKRLLNYSPPYSITEGLSNMISSYFQEKKNKADSE